MWFYNENFSRQSSFKSIYLTPFIYVAIPESFKEVSQVKSELLTADWKSYEKKWIFFKKVTKFGISIIFKNDQKFL